MSSDPLQGLAEMVQNADDVDATEVRLLLEPTELLVSHNGDPVRFAPRTGLSDTVADNEGWSSGANGTLWDRSDDAEIPLGDT